MFKPGLIVSLNNGYYGYLPTPEQHDLGGYETWLGTNRLEKRAATKILEMSFKLGLFDTRWCASERA